MKHKNLDVTDLVGRASQGQARAIGQLISLVESESDRLREVSDALAPFAGRAHVIGLTGSPGVGKSTSTSALITRLREQGRTVGVLAIDPSSPFSGGALLGDRIRMGDHTTDPGVFIRSLASRGHLGGLSWATPHAVRVLDAAGCDVVLIETVGVGQSEIEITHLADTTVVLLAPGMGDGIQAAKAGIIEIGDVFAINKADRDGAATTRRELRAMLSMSHARSEWKPPIQLTVATNGEGVTGLVDALDAHREHLLASGQWQARRRARLAGEIKAIALYRLMKAFDEQASDALAHRSAQVYAGELGLFEAADELVARLRLSGVDLG